MELKLELVDVKDAGAFEVYGSPVVNYEDIIKSFGPILLRQEYGIHEGDTLVLYGYDWQGQVAYLCFGWGSLLCL